MPALRPTYSLIDLLVSLECQCAMVHLGLPSCIFQVCEYCVRLCRYHHGFAPWNAVSLLDLSAEMPLKSMMLHPSKLQSVLIVQNIGVLIKKTILLAVKETPLRWHSLSKDFHYSSLSRQEELESERYFNTLGLKSDTILFSALHMEMFVWKTPRTFGSFYTRAQFEGPMRPPRRLWC